MSEYKLGYNIEAEDHDFLDSLIEPETILKSAKAAHPDHNPYAPSYTWIEDQKSIGSCQGCALALCFQIALVQRFGVQARFSKMGAYIWSQQEDNLAGRDQGSTLSGGMKAAKKGLCLENVYEYPNPVRYSSSVPSSANGQRVFKMLGSRKITDVDLIWELLRSGVCVQFGVSWGSSCEQPVCNTYKGGRGGHSCVLTSLEEGTDHAIMTNSWGTKWGQHGRVKWTKNFVSEILRKDRYPSFVCHDPQGLEAPEGFIDRV